MYPPLILHKKTFGELTTDELYELRHLYARWHSSYQNDILFTQSYSMTIQEFRDYMASGKPVVGGSDVHMMFHQLSQEALKIAKVIKKIEV